MLRNPDGKLFGIGQSGNQAFWVMIRVITPRDKYLYDFAANYCLAAWAGGAGNVACGGSSGTAGSVILLNQPDLEIGKDDELTLQVKPSQDRAGSLSGKYPSIIVNDGDRFQSWVGCMSGSDGCDLTFVLSYRADGGALQTLGEWREVLGGKATQVDIDLSFLAKRKVEFTLTVKTNNTNYKAANGFWFVPRITNLSSTAQDTPAVLAARKMVAAFIGVSPEQLKVVQVDGPITWSDSCLEVPGLNQVCAAVIVSGYRVLLEYGNSRYEAHTNLDGTIVYWFYAS